MSPVSLWRTVVLAGLSDCASPCSQLNCLCRYQTQLLAFNEYFLGILRFFCSWVLLSLHWFPLLLLTQMLILCRSRGDCGLSLFACILRFEVTPCHLILLKMLATVFGFAIQLLCLFYTGIQGRSRNYASNVAATFPKILRITILTTSLHDLYAIKDGEELIEVLGHDGPLINSCYIILYLKY